MSLDLVYPPRDYPYFSPPTHLKKFADEAFEAENALFKFFNGDSPAEDDPRTTFVDFCVRHGIGREEAVKSVRETDQSLEAVIEAHPILEFEAVFPPADSKFQTHKVLNKIRKYPSAGKKYKNDFILKGKYFKYRDFALDRTMDLPQPTADKDFVITANLIAPENLMSNKGQLTSFRKSCRSKFLLRGSTSLKSLRDKIACSADMWCNKEDFESPTDPNSYFVNRFPSSFIFIYDTFYVDEQPGTSDISEPVRAFMKRKHQSFKEHQVKSLDQVKLEELTLRLGQPYVFVHQGHCEHLLIFTELRLLEVRDSREAGEYPALVFDAHPRTSCCVCKERLPSIVVTESDRMPVNPAFMCEDCFKSFHYERNVRIGQFKAYHYLDRGCIE